MIHALNMHTFLDVLWVPHLQMVLWLSHIMGGCTQVTLEMYQKCNGKKGNALDLFLMRFDSFYCGLTGLMCRFTATQENVCLFWKNCVSGLPLAHCSQILVSLPNATVLSVFPSLTGPEWASLSALEFHASDQPTLDHNILY